MNYQNNEQNGDKYNIIITILIIFLVTGYALVLPVLMHMNIPGNHLTLLEKLLGTELPLTWHLIVVFLLNVLVFEIAYAVRSQASRGKSILSGIPGAVAIYFELIYGTTKNIVTQTKGIVKMIFTNVFSRIGGMFKKKSNRKGKKRYIFFLVIILSVVGAIFFPPIMPHIQLQAEPIIPLGTFLGQEFALTNTLIATFLADIFILLVALAIRSQLKKGNVVLTGFAGIFAALYEILYDFAQKTAGKYTRRIYPWFATLFMIILVVNWMELFPGVDSIGLLHVSEHGYPVQQVIPGVYAMVKQGAEGAAHEATTYGIYPIIRAAATDLNFTISLALISVSMVQIFGFSVLGRKYMVKYWNTEGLKKAWKEKSFGNPMDFVLSIVNWAVGLLEVISETSKIISFAFRLFGVIFAGQVLLFVIGTLVPVFAQSPFYLLEMFFGALQAFVFSMLTMIFMVSATRSHGGDAH